MKKFLSVFMSCALLTTSFVGVVKGQPPAASSIGNRMSAVCHNKKNKDSKLNRFLKITGITAGCLAGAELLLDCGRELCFLGTCNFLSKHPETMDSNLTKIDGMEMERQQGYCWCWNACLTRALSKQGLKDLTQKKVYKAMGGSRWWVSPWKSKRDQGSLFNIDEKSLDEKLNGLGFLLRWLINPVYRDQIEFGVEKLSAGKLKFQNVNLPWEKLKLDSNDRLYSSRVVTKFLGRVLNKVRETNREAIIITLCPFSTVGHAVTVEEVDDKQIIFGEPTSGLMVGLPCDKFFSAKKSILRDIFPNELLLYKEGLAVVLVVKKGQELSRQWVNKMIAEVVAEAEGTKKEADIAA